MKKAIICRSQIYPSEQHRREAGVTMILVAICMVAIIAMAALSIDVVTLYLARMETQRTADTAALAAARVISVSGITGDVMTDTTSWQAICGASGIATQAAKAVASQTVENASPTVTVNYSSQGASTGVSDCSALTSAFTINPTVIVQVTRSGLPTLFSRMWNRNTNSVSATAMAEAFNPSNSASIAAGGEVIPVWPRCVKPWIVPNRDPLSPAPSGTTYCDQGTPPGTCSQLIDPQTGQIQHSGISLSGTNTNGVIGERFWLIPNCLHRVTGVCSLRSNPPLANHTTGGTGGSIPGTPPYNLVYWPGQTVNASVAVPSAASGGSLYEQAVAGCDQTTVYQCGVQSSVASNPNMVDLSENPASTGDTTNGVMALIRENNPNPSGGQPDGQDTLNPYAAPAAYPFQILAGTSNPYVTAGLPVSGSSSIATVPIYDGASLASTTGTSPVTIIGFLQVFINSADQYGNVDVTVLNVSGCGNGTNPTGTAVVGSSPVPVRLITQ